MQDPEHVDVEDHAEVVVGVGRQGGGGIDPGDIDDGVDKSGGHLGHGSSDGIGHGGAIPDVHRHRCEMGMVQPGVRATVETDDSPATLEEHGRRRLPHAAGDPRDKSCPQREPPHG